MRLIIRLAVAVAACLSMTALPSGSPAAVADESAAPGVVSVKAFAWATNNYSVGTHRISTRFDDGHCKLTVDGIEGWVLCTAQWGLAYFEDGSLRVSGIGENRGGYHLYVRPDHTSPAGWEHLGGWLTDYFKFVSVHDKNNFSLIGHGSDGETNYCRAYRYPGSGWTGWFACAN